MPRPRRSPVCSELFANGYVWEASTPSLARIGLGLLWAVVIGVPVGVGIGLFASLREVTHVPFQFLRMISPLAWMPVAVLAFATWDGAIVFLITVAAIWPVLFSTAQGVRRIDPLWFKVAKNLGADSIRRMLSAPRFFATLNHSGSSVAPPVRWRTAPAIAATVIRKTMAPSQVAKAGAATGCPAVARSCAGTEMARP